MQPVTPRIVIKFGASLNRSGPNAKSYTAPAEVNPLQEALQREAKQYGVKRAVYTDSLALGKRINNVLAKLHQAHWNLKDTLIFVDKDTHKHLVKQYGPKNACPEREIGITLDTKHCPTFEWNEAESGPTPIIVSFNPDPKINFMEKCIEKTRRFFQKTGYSTTHSEHLIVHEIVHALHHQNLRAANINPSETIKTLKFEDGFWEQVKKSVSPYAADSRNVMEVVAEIGTARLIGIELPLPDAVREVWEQWWQGPELPFGLLKEVAAESLN